MLNDLKKLINNKVLTGLGFLLAMTIGSWVGTTLATSLISFFAAGYVAAFLIHTALYLSGIFFGVGLYVQGLKEFSSWPMENTKTRISFRPSVLLEETIFTLKKFDWELLKFFGRVIFNQMHPEIDEILNTEVEEPQYKGWFSLSYWNYRLVEKTKSVANAVIDDSAANFTREGIGLSIHTFIYENRNATKLDNLSQDNYEKCIQQEALKYKSNPLINRFRSSKTGLIESVAHTLYDEYQHPAKIK